MLFSLASLCSASQNTYLSVVELFVYFHISDYNNHQANNCYLWECTCDQPHICSPYFKSEFQNHSGNDTYMEVPVKRACLYSHNCHLTSQLFDNIWILVTQKSTLVYDIHTPLLGMWATGSYWVPANVHIVACLNVCWMSTQMNGNKGNEDSRSQTQP